MHWNPDLHCSSYLHLLDLTSYQVEDVELLLLHPDHQMYQVLLVWLHLHLEQRAGEEASSGID